MANYIRGNRALGTTFKTLMLGAVAGLIFAGCAAPAPDATTTAVPSDNTTSQAGDKSKQPATNDKPGPTTGTPATDKTPNSGSQAPCLTTEDIYIKQVWAPFLSTTCNKCHQPIGMAKDTKFVLAPPSETGHVAKNLKMLANVAKFDVNGTSILLLKPSGQIDHAGGKVFEKGSEEYTALELLIERLKNPVECIKQPTSSFFNGVTILGPQATLRKAAINLTGRLPTAAEMDLIAAEGEVGLSKAIDMLMGTQAFITRVKELYAEVFLQGRYDKYNSALGLLSANLYPHMRWYEMARYNDPKLYGKLVYATNKGIARQATELVGHIVRTNRPFSEVLTADYTMLNAYAARSYGVLALGYKDGQDMAQVDPDKFFPVKLPFQPHAGVLTTPVWLARFPTTATNRNRHRSLKVYAQWLATDVLAQEDRPTDVTSISGFNPTMYHPQCRVCHSIVDPIAGTFQNWDTSGRYNQPAKGWHPDMRPPGFAETEMPFSRSHEALKWLAETITDDPRFAQSAVETSYTLLTGRQPLRMPADPEAPDFVMQMQAYDAQHDDLKKIADSFVAQNRNFKVAVKGVVLSKWFRAVNLNEQGQKREESLNSVGTAELLTPEQLDRKIRSLTGFSWSNGKTDLLTSMSGYLLLYGGTDGDQVEARVKVPSGIMSALAERMANQMACLVVPRELRMAPGTRKLLPLIEETTVPENEKGIDAKGQAQIKANIQYLHAHLLGENLDADDPELTTSYKLWLSTWEETSLDPNGALPGACHVNKDLKTGMKLPKHQRLNTDKHGTVRAWMTVVSYMLADYKFTHQ